MRSYARQPERPGVHSRRATPLGRSRHLPASRSLGREQPATARLHPFLPRYTARIRDRSLPTLVRTVIRPLFAGYISCSTIRATPGAQSATAPASAQTSSSGLGVQLPVRATVEAVQAAQAQPHRLTSQTLHGRRWRRSPGTGPLRPHQASSLSQRETSRDRHAAVRRTPTGLSRCQQSRGERMIEKQPMKSNGWNRRLP